MDFASQATQKVAQNLKLREDEGTNLPASEAVTEPLGTTGVRRFGVFEFDPSTRELRKQGVRIRLQGQPMEILALFMERPGEIVTREELQKKLWPADTFVDFEHSLNAAVKRLRDALDDSAETPRYIETMARRGYRFLVPVERLNGISSAGIPANAELRRRTIAAMQVVYAVPFVCNWFEGARLMGRALPSGATWTALIVTWVVSLGLAAVYLATAWRIGRSEKSALQSFLRWFPLHLLLDCLALAAFIGMAVKFNFLVLYLLLLPVLCCLPFDQRHLAKEALAKVQ